MRVCPRKEIWTEQRAVKEGRRADKMERQEAEAWSELGVCDIVSTFIDERRIYAY